MVMPDLFGLPMPTDAGCKIPCANGQALSIWRFHCCSLFSRSTCARGIKVYDEFWKAQKEVNVILRIIPFLVDDW